MAYDPAEHQVSPDGKYKHTTTEENHVYSTVGLEEINANRESGMDNSEFDFWEAYREEWEWDLYSAGTRAGHTQSLKNQETRQQSIASLDGDFKTAAQAASDNLGAAEYRIETADALHAEVKDKMSRDGKTTDWWRQSEDGRPLWTDDAIQKTQYEPLDTMLGGRVWNDYTTQLNKSIDAAQEPIVLDAEGAGDGGEPDAKLVAMFSKEAPGSFSVKPVDNTAQAKDMHDRVNTVQAKMAGMMPEMETLAKRAAGGDVEGVNLSSAYTSAYFAMSMAAGSLLKSMGMVAEIMNYQCRNYTSADDASAGGFGGGAG